MNHFMNSTEKAGGILSFFESWKFIGKSTSNSSHFYLQKSLALLFPYCLTRLNFSTLRNFFFLKINLNRLIGKDLYLMRIGRTPGLNLFWLEVRENLTLTYLICKKFDLTDWKYLIEVFFYLSGLRFISHFTSLLNCSLCYNSHFYLLSIDQSSH